MSSRDRNWADEEDEYDEDALDDPEAPEVATRPLVGVNRLSWTTTRNMACPLRPVRCILMANMYGYDSLS